MSKNHTDDLNGVIKHGNRQKIEVDHTWVSTPKPGYKLDIIEIGR